MSDEYQPRTAERLVEILRSKGTNPRSWEAEAADAIERLQDALELRKNMMDRMKWVVSRARRDVDHALDTAETILLENDGIDAVKPELPKD